MLEKYPERARASISRLPLPNIYHDIMSTNKRITSRKTTTTRGLTPRFLNPFFFLFLDAYCVYARRKILGHCRRRRCCKKLSSVITKRWVAASSLFREGKPAHSSNVFASYSSPCEKEMRYEKWLKTSCIRRLKTFYKLHISLCIFIYFF